MTDQPKVCPGCGSDDPELYGGDCFIYPGPHDAYHDPPASEPTRFMWCCRRCSAHVETDGKGVPQCGTCGSDMVRYRLDTPASEPPPDHEEGQ